MSRREDTERRIDLYAFSASEKRELVEWARESGGSVSPFLMAKLREARAAERRRRPPRMAQELEDLKKRISELERELSEARAARDQYRQMLDREKALAFPIGDDGEYSQALIAALKDHGPLHERALLLVLGVEEWDRDLRQAISAQLEGLEGYGLVRKTAQGWKWVG